MCVFEYDDGLSGPGCCVDQGEGRVEQIGRVRRGRDLSCAEPQELLGCGSATGLVCPSASDGPPRVMALTVTVAPRHARRPIGWKRAQHIGDEQALSHSGGSGHDHEASAFASESCDGRGQLELSTDTAFCRLVDRVVCCERGRADLRCRPGEQRRLDRSQLLRRFDTQVVDQPATLGLERFECVADSPGTMEGRHVKSGDSLVVGLALDLGLDRSEQRRALAVFESQLDEQLASLAEEERHPTGELIDRVNRRRADQDGIGGEPFDLDELANRLTVVRRRGGSGGGQGGLHERDVDLAPCSVELVPAALDDRRADAMALEKLVEPADVIAERGPCRCGRLVTPEVMDELFGVDGYVAAGKQSETGRCHRTRRRVHDGIGRFDSDHPRKADDRFTATLERWRAHGCPRSLKSPLSS